MINPGGTLHDAALVGRRVIGEGNGFGGFGYTLCGQ
jgi:hypothetical protein